MGLDSVELVMEFEEAFGVELKDEEVVQITTPRMAIDLILSKLDAVQQTTCLSQRAFYLLRRAFVEHLGVARSAVRPNTQLGALIATDRIVQIWPALEQTLQARVWPSLVRCRSLVAVLYALACAFLLVVFALLAPAGIPSAIAGALIATGIFAIVATLATERRRTQLPADIEQVRDLVPYVASSDQIQWTPEKVAHVVKMLVIEQLGLSESDYHKDAHFVKDFNMD
jgi:acyl carrier protein